MDFSYSGLAFCAGYRPVAVWIDSIEAEERLEEEFAKARVITLGGGRVGGRIEGGKEGTDVRSKLGTYGREFGLDDCDGRLFRGGGGR